jgi:hypothetical protein
MNVPVLHFLVILLQVFCTAVMHLEALAERTKAVLVLKVPPVVNDEGAASDEG